MAGAGANAAGTGEQLLMRLLQTQQEQMGQIQRLLEQDQRPRGTVVDTKAIGRPEKIGGTLEEASRAWRQWNYRTFQQEEASSSQAPQIAALADPPLTNHKGERDAWVGQVTDLLDRMLDPKQVEQARKEQLRKLWDRGAFTPVLRSEVPRGAQLFRAKWVDKCDKGRYKSRCTCADVKARYSPEQEAGLDVFVPTPTPESHSLLEVAALHNEGWVTRSLDIVAAFLIGRDRGAAEGRPVYMHAPVEWRELFDQWVLEQPAKDQQWYRDHFRDFVFRVDGNLYGRRTAGSVYRDELEEVLTGKLAKDYDFQRGVKDPCVYLDRRSGLILLHHIDDIRVAGPKAAVLKFTEVDLPTHCEITVGELEEPGTAVEVLGRTKVRTEDSILTLPDSKHAENVCEQLGIGPKDKGTVPSRPLDLTKVEELSAGDAARFRSAVGSAIYLSADRRDIQFAVKELARRMQNPRVCDWLAAETLARYLRATPRFGRVVVLDPASKSTALLNLEVYSDSDWAGCPETRRSTDNIVACLGGAVIQTSCQTQPGLPATSSGDAEIRGVSRAAREAVFLRELAEKDFALACGLRHLEVAEFFVQGALRAKLLELRKVKGTENPANFATKHAKTGPEVRQSLPSMGMVDLDAVAGATEALAQKGTIKTIQASPWKMRPPTKLTSSALMATIVALQVRPAKAQGHDFAELEPEPEEEIEHHAERAEEPPRAARRATEVWLGPEAPQEAQGERREQQPRGAQEAEPEGERTPGPPPAAAPPPPPPAAPRHLYETARGDKIHLFTNCNGLSSVPPDQVLIGFRCHCAADPQNSEFLWTGFAFQVATGRVVRRYHGQQQGDHRGLRDQLVEGVTPEKVQEFNRQLEVVLGSGLDMYRRLHGRLDSSDMVTSFRWLRQLMSTKPVAEVSDLIAAAERWEDQHRRYAARRDCTALTERQKMASLLRLVPAELQSHLELKLPRLTTYDLLRREIVTFAENRGAFAVDDSGAIPMGKGQGKGKGKVPQVWQNDTSCQGLLEPDRHKEEQGCRRRF
ncbi:unnamed protein product [Symbiodinium sp. CCMP2592]|nr:unnamed protein product [Symbiodinium sp. CCMP2592]